MSYVVLPNNEAHSVRDEVLNVQQGVMFVSPPAAVVSDGIEDAVAVLSLSALV